MSHQGRRGSSESLDFHHHQAIKPRGNGNHQLESRDTSCLGVDESESVVEVSSGTEASAVVMIESKTPAAHHAGLSVVFPYHVPYVHAYPTHHNMLMSTGTDAHHNNIGNSLMTTHHHAYPSLYPQHNINHQPTTTTTTPSATYHLHEDSVVPASGHHLSYYHHHHHYYHHHQEEVMSDNEGEQEVARRREFSMKKSTKGKIMV